MYFPFLHYTVRFSFRNTKIVKKLQILKKVRNLEKISISSCNRDFYQILKIILFFLHDNFHAFYMLTLSFLHFNRFDYRFQF
jgi:hypothetical protein